MEADQGRWDILDEYLAHFTAYIVRPQLKKTSRLKPADLLLRPRKIKNNVVDLDERREFFEDFKRRHGSPKRRQ